jgi:cation transport regulator ChaB
LEKEGSLEQRLENAANFTLKGYEVEKKRLLERGYQENQAHEVAWELVREEWLLLPDQDQKDYGKAKENANPDLMQLLGSKNPPRRVKMPETSE